MKKDLGRAIFFILFAWHVEVFASEYVWSAYTDKTQAVTNEAIYLKYVCDFDDEAELYVIEFNPVVDNDLYTIKLLSENEKIIGHKKRSTYEFVAYAKQAGKLELEFDLIMKKTNRDSIENTVLGRDNAQFAEFTKRYMRQKKLTIDVEKAENDLVGDFSIKVQKDEPAVKAYEPFHMDLSIEGKGNFDAIREIEFKLDGVKVFAEKPLKEILLKEDGYHGMWKQKFAFVSDKDFTVPALRIGYYDTAAKSTREMFVEETQVRVAQAYAKDELLDEPEKELEFDYGYVYYLLTFISGFLAAKIKFPSRKRTDSGLDEELFKEKIKNAKSLEEIAVILILKDAKKYENIISNIERKNVTSLKDVKKNLLN
ncbi:BatD family protein [bacterium]|nr:BatD family protein [bacterium]MBU1991296.1 BatD family protein [bacterium]